ncbi:MAG: FAD-binding protein [Flavobacteriaceae bacterium]|nr:MAG: FAD-binding protein [Flavobacteriaceae bacterium]
MTQEISLKVAPKSADSFFSIVNLIKKKLNLHKNDKVEYQILKKSLDARGKNVVYLLLLRVWINQEKPKELRERYLPTTDKFSSTTHIVGAGPAGLFCALQCLLLGIKPIIIERGKDIKSRRRDLAALNKEGVLNPESNYCFGEGGAGTYSDGKLYTRSKKRGDVLRVLSWLVDFGAKESILYEAHPHIGTNKLPQIIENIRNKIIELGGEVHFQTKLTDLLLKNGKVKSIQVKQMGTGQEETLLVDTLVLATGHSASDIYHLLDEKNIELQAKSFALGVRIEHPQPLIDAAQYGMDNRGDYLPPASYSLVKQTQNGRGVFSFCMCPGGIIAPASTEYNKLVVNGWSPSKRNNPFANSGMVVTVLPEDFKDNSALAGLEFQGEVEEKAFNAGGGNFRAPAQRMVDFVNGIISQDLPKNSYNLGLTSCDLSKVLPTSICESLKEALPYFGEKIKGYYTNDAVLVATESRTSSPVRIPRDPQSFAHPQVSNLFPCSEGAGYAGGIVSAAMDGMNVALKLIEKIK